MTACVRWSDQSFCDADQDVIWRIWRQSTCAPLAASCSSVPRRCRHNTRHPFLACKRRGEPAAWVRVHAHCWLAAAFLGGAGTIHGTHFQPVKVEVGLLHRQALCADLAGMRAAYNNGKVLVVGQGNSATYEYNIASNTWSTKAARPFAGNHHSSVIYQGKHSVLLHANFRHAHVYTGMSPYLCHEVTTQSSCVHIGRAST